MRYKDYELMPVSYQEEGANEWQASIKIIHIDTGASYPFEINNKTFKTKEDADAAILFRGKQKIDNGELSSLP